MEFSNAKNNFSKEPFEYPYTKPAYMKNLIDYFNPLADAGLVVVELLKYLNVPATRTTIQKELVEHPDYPSLLSLSDVLKNLGVDNMAIHVKPDRFKELPLPFLAHINIPKSRSDLFVVIKDMDQEEISFFNPKTKSVEKLSIEELSSNPSKIMGLSWSAIGAIYFLGMLMSLLICGPGNPASLFILGWLGVLALAYTFFSVYYEGFILKQWCTLCLIVQVIFILQALVAISGGFLGRRNLYANTISEVIALVASFAIAFIFINILLPSLKTSKTSKSRSVELQRLKHNPQIFDALLVKQKRAEIDPSGLGILLGKPDAKYKLIKVCNSYCTPCAKAHKHIEELLQNNPEVSVQIIFTATDENDYRNKPVAHLMPIQQKDSEQLTKALDDWYLSPQRDYIAFAATHPMEDFLSQQKGKIGAMHDWCEETAITFTPTFFINGYQLPSLYFVSDLKYFLMS